MYYEWLKHVVTNTDIVHTKYAYTSCVMTIWRIWRIQIRIHTMISVHRHAGIEYMVSALPSLLSYSDYSTKLQLIGRIQFVFGTTSMYA